MLKGLDNPEFFKPAIAGALAQFIDVEPQHVAPVEAALGANLQAIGMKDTMVAGHIMKTLSSQKLGKVVLALKDLDQTFEHVENAALDSAEAESLGAEAYELDWAKIDALVRELYQRIDSTGPVNLDAIPEYEEMEQRFAFLEKQHLDLMNSKEELLGVIARINNTTRQLFAETFEKIRTNFQEMFTELFGGGRANLVLTDESDPLESGIDIIAKPLGKQLQSISLLSGGEKTMTAASLLFSIYMVKPSPFCVLEEMNAPLDESNINRFIKIPDRFVGQSQFVVISHKKTIARADALYGVTLEEHGVSLLVGVKFTKRDESSSGADVTGSSNPEAVPSVAKAFEKGPDLHSENTTAESA